MVTNGQRPLMKRLHPLTEDIIDDNDNTLIRPAEKAHIKFYIGG